MPRPVPRLIAFDLDGTLLPGSKRVSDYTLEVLARMVDLGAQLTLATGKFHHLTLGHGEELGLDTPLISLDGACIGNRDHPERKHGVPSDAAHEALELFEDVATHAFCDSGDDVMLLRSSWQTFGDAMRFWADDRRHVEALAPHVSGEPTILTFYGEIGPMRERADHMRETHPDLRVTEYHSSLIEGHRVSIQPAVDKGTGVLETAAELGVEAEEVMVFGDWLNDLPMFRIGVVGVAMANAVPEVQEAADHVTEATCDEDGVARFLEDLFLS
ncbi:MAG: HAD family hydrolase [Thermoanaerobaculia bacterium]|nr:HAD family hydrolase [Thermoanaerobaculia bacterium]